MSVVSNVASNVVPKLRALVVEDEWATRNDLARMLEASGAAEVVGAVATAEAARQALDAASADGAIDVAFVDVELVGSARDDEGLALVRAYAARPGAPAFVLATAFREHAVEAFDLELVDYLLKPFTEERVGRCLARIKTRRLPRGGDAPAAPARIVARRRRALVFLRLAEVWAFESAERLTYVHTPQGRYEVDLSLSAIEASIGRTLLRVHRSWLVNAEHVRELEGYGSETELLVGGGGGGPEALAYVRVPVARERAAAVREALVGSAMGIRAR